MYFCVQDSRIVTSFSAALDASACITDMAAHFALHPARWQAAFRFLSELFPVGQTLAERQEVVARLVRGRVDIAEGVYANIADYTPKPLSLCCAESHKRYIDIQYVAQGQEYIGVTREVLPVLTPYDAERDIAFYAIRSMQYLRADAAKFFVFFPADLHAPGIAISDNACDTTQCTAPEKVTKIVVKLLY